MTPLEESLLNDYKRRYDLIFQLCFEYRNYKDGGDFEFYNLLIKKASGLKMLIDYMEKSGGVLNGQKPNHP